jgi:hypothetical protein
MLFNFFRVKSLPMLLLMVFLAMSCPSLQAASQTSQYKGTYQGTFTIIQRNGLPQVWTLVYKMDSKGNMTSGKASFGSSAIMLYGNMKTEGMISMCSSQSQSGLKSFIFSVGGQASWGLGQTSALLWNIVNTQGRPLPLSQQGPITVKKISNS